MTPRTSCIAHPPEDRFLIVRQSFVDLLGGDHCAAALLSVLEFWANGSLITSGVVTGRKVTVRDFRDALMSLYKERSIRTALARLAELGFVKIEGEAGDPTGRTYAIDPNAVNRALGFESTPAKAQGDPGKNARPPRQERKGLTLHSPHAREEGKKEEGDTRASAPPVNRSAQETPKAGPDTSGAVVAAAEIVASAQGVTLPTHARDRRAWLRGAEPLAAHPPETVRAAVDLKLRREPERWRTKPLWPRFVAEDWPTLIRELENQQAPASKPLDAFDELRRAMEAA